MTLRLGLSAALVTSASLCLSTVTACRPVERDLFAVAQRSMRLSPSIMLLLDTSGSMSLPLSPQHPSCVPDCGVTPASPCPSACLTRMDALRTASRALLSELGAEARLGLTLFPGGPDCAAPVTPRVELPSAASDGGSPPGHVEAILAGIDAATPAGGTPTAAALRALADYAPLHDPARASFIILLTDGLPNCNASNTNSCMDPAACECTLASCGASEADRYCREGCLDGAPTLEAVRALRQKGVRTVLIGLGPEAAGSRATALLNALSLEGGLPKACEGADGGATCDRHYYVALDAAQLASALQAARSAIHETACAESANPGDCA